MTGRAYVYDAGPLISAERNERRMWALHAALLADGVVPIVPAPVLAQVWRGGPRQAGLSRLLAGCVVEPYDETDARAGGDLLGRAGSSDVVDACVVTTAQARRAIVLTSDPVDLNRLGAASGQRLDLIAV